MFSCGIIIEERGSNMEIDITSNLKMESDIPFVAVEAFHFLWIPNQHSQLSLSGYIDSSYRFDITEMYNRKIKIWQNKNDENKTLFWGYLVKIEMESVGKTTKMHLVAKSGSHKLDQKAESQSFQNIDKTYAEVIRLAVERAGGKTICESGINQKIEKPLIQYEETVWEFCKRLASHLNTCIIPDIEISGECFWFGMRKGKHIPDFSANEYDIRIGKGDYGKEIGYYVKSRDFYKIGDKTLFCNQEMIICKVSARFENGELIFKYLLRHKEPFQTVYHNNILGLGLKGTVIDTREEQVKIALDIDGGNSTGDYFYDWYPETGNALYAIPERGTRILLYFGSHDEREGFAIHNFLDSSDFEKNYKDRYFNTMERHSMHLTEGDISFTNGVGNNVTIEDDHVSARSTETMNISAQGDVRISAKRITINTPDEINICQG